MNKKKRKYFTFVSRRVRFFVFYMSTVTLSFLFSCFFITTINNAAPSNEAHFLHSQEIDSKFSKFMEILKYVTFLNVFYCLMILYIILTVLYTIIFFKRFKMKMLIKSKLKSVKVETPVIKT
ncbi:CLUMA_CG020504, isoform A [Clunio marinus]|uniref:CLUMA_CG020504, isoform A n=1 Tax=Clunio marinus TaxID=568069 RepID=A0A1J1J553_9DIPT|nr:CLUMA_CG020504, isoform A [Clunio marinus]